MNQTLPEEQKQLLINILKDPADGAAKKAYSEWLHNNNHKQQAEAVDYILNSGALSKPINFAAGKREFEADLMKAIGLNPTPNHCSFGFSIKIEGEKLLKKGNFFDLKFEGDSKEASQFKALSDRISKHGGKIVMMSLAAGYIADTDLQREPRSYEHALYKATLRELGDQELGNERKVAIAQAIYEKTINPNFPEHTAAARLIHGITGNYPENYEYGYGKRGGSLADDAIIEDGMGDKNPNYHKNALKLSHQNRSGGIQM